jgi:hypothetical protein
MDEPILDRLTRMRREHALAPLRGVAVPAESPTAALPADHVEIRPEPSAPAMPGEVMTGR